jgi:hypothetical protein
MVYQPHSLERHIQPMRQAIGWGAWLIAIILGLGLLTKELQRILSSSLRLSAFLYLVLLLLVCVLVAGWKWVSQKELELLCEWLDPRSYAPPEETIVIFGISVALGLLLLTAYSPLLFGITYLLYCGFNFGAWLHFRNQLTDALEKSRERLKEEGVDAPEKDSIYAAALNGIEHYYIKRPHMYRFILILTLAALGLAAAVYGVFQNSGTALVASYVAYIIAVFIFEALIITRWRLKYYAELRPLSTAISELVRKRL